MMSRFPLVLMPCRVEIVRDLSAVLFQMFSNALKCVFTGHSQLNDLTWNKWSWPGKECPSHQSVTTPVVPLWPSHSGLMSARLTDHKDCFIPIMAPQMSHISENVACW